MSRSSSSSSSASARKPLLAAAGVALAAVTLGLVSWQATAPAEETADTASSSAAAPADPHAAGARPELVALARREAADPMAVGRADAPVVLIEYADYRCGYCGKYARDTEPALIEKYVENGTLRIEWRNSPIFGAESEAAARAAWAAGRQGRFAQFHAAAYAEGAKEQGFGADRLAELAKQAGVPDLARFTRDMDGTEAKAALARDTAEAQRIGVSSTPSFLVNGRPIAGAQPESAFTEAIEAAARAAGKAKN
ncbi:thioredoxin domain-containing protein [Streptomyces bambusae]|uniref:DsbA family protein n=1 Tax=Streptomyces bambusae TaxID=1550616 RepID=UPI001CFFC3DC|nr:thioredoxin domain-containing protein [Streptomyces bambusae]MCB5169678.1 thioredoxin domain-containing protein [Streptomyces bambusae]